MNKRLVLLDEREVALLDRLLNQSNEPMSTIIGVGESLYMPVVEALNKMVVEAGINDGLTNTRDFAHFMFSSVIWDHIAMLRTEDNLSSSGLTDESLNGIENAIDMIVNILDPEVKHWNDEDGSTQAIAEWIKYISNCTDEDPNQWSTREIGEYSWAELVAVKENDGDIKPQTVGDMIITQGMIDWSTKYASDHHLGDDWSLC